MWRILARPSLRTLAYVFWLFAAYSVICTYIRLVSAFSPVIAVSYNSFFTLWLLIHSSLSATLLSLATDGSSCLVFRSRRIKKDSYHDLCHNKSLAFSFDTDVSQHRLTVSNPHGMFLFQIPRRFATPFYLLR